VKRIARSGEDRDVVLWNILDRGDGPDDFLLLAVG
jgi:hypothetical protein